MNRRELESAIDIANKHIKEAKKQLSRAGGIAVDISANIHNVPTELFPKVVPQDVHINTFKLAEDTSAFLHAQIENVGVFSVTIGEER